MRIRARVAAAARETRGFFTLMWLILRWFFGGLASGLADDALVLARLKFYPSIGRALWRSERHRRVAIGLAIALAAASVAATHLFHK